MSVGHNAKTAAEAGLQPWLHGGGGGGEAACVRLSIRKSIIGPRAGLQKGRRMCATFWKFEPKAARRDAVTRIQDRYPENGDDDLLFAGFRVPGNVMPDRIAVAPGRLKRESQSIRRTPSGDLNRQHVEDRTINVIN